jgi:hypothetical protein
MGVGFGSDVGWRGHQGLERARGTTRCGESMLGQPLRVFDAFERQACTRTIVQKPLAACVREPVADLGRHRQHVQRHDGCTRVDDAEPGGDDLGRVVGEERHAVAR